MSIPWIKIEQNQDSLADTGMSEYAWQAIFACQVGVRPYQEWVKLKWGFNASALFDEALERQRLFLESQYTLKNDFRLENTDQRTLAYRFIARPGDGILIAILGKIQAQSREDVYQSALSYYRELKSIFPYDYFLVPATTEKEFLSITGGDILEDTNTLHLAQVKRIELPIHPRVDSPVIQGLWQSGPRSHEQIWRLLATSQQPAFINISIRSSILYERERKLILDSADRIANFTDDEISQISLSAQKKWNEKYIERRFAPWKKFFYLQVHLASTGEIDKNIFRIAGTSLSLNPEGQSVPGYQESAPRGHEAGTWLRKLMNLDFVHSGSRLSAPRLAEIADMEEVFAVMRLPYSPPENGFPEMKFASTREESNEI